MDDRNERSWEEVDRLFDAALDVPEDERSAFLSRECSDPAVRARVDRLLAAEAASRGMLEPSTVQRAFMDVLADDVASGDAEPRTEVPDRTGEQVGSYRLEKLVGHGGMATVYAARRVEGGFEQRAAIKLIRTDANTDELVRRFESERAILSGLRHANIARLLDGGSTADGVPYLAMDFIEGRPITEQVRKFALDIEARLWLFLEVAGAVSYAHANLVVHRDLKPSNILVDDEKHPMLLDFGIAKLLAEDGVEEGITQTRPRWMTPGYAAPEQIQGDAVTTATDVYQLGVLLFELLTEQRPYDVEGRSTYEIERMICEDDPPRPSDVADTGFRSDLVGDLDAIVLKAMRKEPEERYSSVEALAADIRRHLTAEPVEAHRGGRAYRAHKFVRRHRGGVLAASVVLLLLTGWAVTATVQRQQVAAERDRAELESEKATQVTAFLTSLLQAEDPREAQGTDPSLREILERGVERIGEELSDQPDVQAELYLTTGTVYEALGEYSTADSLLERAVELRSDLYSGGPSEELAEALVMLGQLRMEQARFDEAVPLMESALEQRRALDPSGTEAIADYTVEVGDALRLVGRPAEALALYEDAMDAYAGLDSLPLASVAITRNNIALVHHQAGRLAEATPLYERAVQELMEDLGPRHPYT
ncbi:MAG: protein kinase, partial [Gemmatimonadetes bacterium]|nr:protein kinase [Gemmatimonadota bacterium]